MPDPESIDIQFSLMDKEALTSFTKAITDAVGLLGQAPDGRDLSRASTTTTGAAAIPWSGRSSGASPPIAQAPTPGGGTSSAQSPGAPVRDIVNSNPNQYTSEQLLSMGGVQPKPSQGDAAAMRWNALQTEPSQGFLQTQLSNIQSRTGVAGIAGYIPGVSGLAAGAQHSLDQGSLQEGITAGVTFGLTNHVVPAIMNSQAVNIAQAGVNPFTASQIGYEQGLTGGSSVGVGPFQMQLPTGPAAGAGFSDVLHAITTGASTGGLSTGQVYSNEQILHAVGASNYPAAITAPSNQGSAPIGPGTTAEDFNTLRSIVETAQKPKDEGGLELKGLDPQWLIEQSMNMTRYGNATQQQVLDSLSGLDEAARSANLSINDFAQQVSSAGEALQQMGPITNLQANQAAMSFTSSTHLPPSAMPGLMQSPLIQGAMIGQTGLPPSLLPGAVASDPGLLTSATLHTINMLSNTFQGQFQPQTQQYQGFSVTESSSAQADQQAAAIAGIPLDQYKQMKRNATQTHVDSAMTAGTQAMSDRIRQITNQTGGPGSPGYAAAIAGLEHGHDPNKIDFGDLIKYAKQPGSGINPADIQKIRDEATPAGGEGKKVDELKAILQAARPANLSQDPNKTYVAFTGYADRMLRTVAANGVDPTGQAATTTQNQGGAKSTSNYLKNAPTDPSGYIRGSHVPNSTPTRYQSQGEP